jgi:hypothetical protein
VKKIELVVHCYAKERPWYAALLCYQISSLVLYKPTKCRVQLTLFYSSGDEHINKLLEYLWPIKNFTIIPIITSVPKLGRRAIGRNIRAKNSNADIIWFTDPDYCFGEGCLDTLGTLNWPKEAVMVFPKSIQEQRMKQLDIPLLKSLALDPKLIDVFSNSPSTDFLRHDFIRAIGSIQIVDGDYARKYGYCANKKRHQTPTEDLFKDHYQTSCDLSFRAECRKNSGSHRFQQSIDLPNIYRLNHPLRKYSTEEAKERYGWNDA